MVPANRRRKGVLVKVPGSGSSAPARLSQQGPPEPSGRVLMSALGRCTQVVPGRDEVRSTKPATSAPSRLRNARRVKGSSGKHGPHPAITQPRQIIAMASANAAMSMRTGDRLNALGIARGSDGIDIELERLESFMWATERNLEAATAMVTPSGNQRNPHEDRFDSRAQDRANFRHAAPAWRRPPRPTAGRKLVQGKGRRKRSRRPTRKHQAEGSQRCALTDGELPVRLLVPTPRPNDASSAEHGPHIERRQTVSSPLESVAKLVLGDYGALRKLAHALPPAL